MKTFSPITKFEKIPNTGVRQRITEKANFLYKFLKSPQNIGSITPSSSFLAQVMIEPVDWKNTRTIAELGAGTGVFTRLIHQLKHPACRGIIFEQDQDMIQYLMGIYQGFSYHSRAEELHTVLERLGLSGADCILSGLPLMNFSHALRERILNEVIHSLKPGGLFIQFQYSLQMREQLVQRFTKVELRFVPLNIPPAFVYYCYK